MARRDFLGDINNVGLDLCPHFGIGGNDDKFSLIITILATHLKLSCITPTIEAIKWLLISRIENASVFNGGLEE